MLFLKNKKPNLWITIDFGKHWCYTYSTMITKIQKDLSETERKALRIIRNWFLHQGRNPSIRELTKEMEFGSTRPALMVINRLIEKEIVLRKEDGSLRIISNLDEGNFNAKTVDVPLVGTVSCGTPIFAKENIESYYPVSTRLAHEGSRYFLLRAQGESMNKAGIQNGDIVLIRQQPTAENGEKVVALIDDEATIKVLKFSGDIVILEPKSTKKEYKPIILSRDFQVQGVVVATIASETLSPEKSHSLK